MGSDAREIAVIGGGVIGVSAAYYLARQGFGVTLIEAGRGRSGASYGNAGLLLASHIVPLAAPGVLGQGLRWLLDASSPFYIQPRLSLSLASWLWRFRAACREERARRAMPVLRELLEKSLALYRELAGEAGLAFGLAQAGLAKLFLTGAAYRQAEEEARLMRAHGLEARLLSFPELRDLGLVLNAAVIGGLYLPGDAHLVPARFVEAMIEACRALGVDVGFETEVIGFETAGDRVIQVLTMRGPIRPDQVVLSAGAWSPALARDLGLRLPIQPAKGYSLTYEGTSLKAALPVLLSEARVAVTPLSEGRVRLAGTLEMTGTDLSVNRRRLEAIAAAVREYMPGLDGLTLTEIWRGPRPLTPDGLPLIGRPQKYANLILACGHNTIGMALGPITGKLVAELAAGQSPSLDLSPLHPDRF